MTKIACVTAILQNPQGQVLLHQRDEKPGLPFAGYWSTLGGKVEPLESPEEAMRRELLEEIGLAVPVTLWKVYERFISAALTIVQYVYTGWIECAISDLVLNEGQDLRYFDAIDLKTLPIAFGFDVLLTDFLAVNLGSANDMLDG